MGLQCLEISAASADFAVTNKFTKFEHHRVTDGVKDGGALSSSADEFGIEKNLKVFRDVRLTAFKVVDEITNGHLARFQALQDAQTKGFA